MATIDKPEMAAKTGETDVPDPDLKNISSIQEAEIVDNRNGTFHRSFSPRQIHVSFSLPPTLPMY
jgi:hypothetical protein